MKVFLLLVLIVVCTANPRQIVEDAWKRYRHSPRYDAMAQHHSHHRRDNHHHGPHTCQHHKHSGPSQRHRGQENPLEITTQKRQIPIPSPTAVDRPMKIFHDTRYLRTDDPYSCKFVGDEVIDNYTNETIVCNEAQVLTQAKIDLLINDVIPAVDSFFTHLIKVRARFQYSPLVLSPSYTTCRDQFNQNYTVLSEEYFTGDGVGDYDFGIMWSSRPYVPELARVLADAKACSWFSEGGLFSRPVFGSVNINADEALNGLTQDDPHAFYLFLTTAFHEVFHAIGVNFDEYPSWRNPETNFTVYENLVANQTQTFHNESFTQYYWTSPNLLAAARKHFGCDAFQFGVPIENQDYDLAGQVDGYYGQHFEERVFPGELMGTVIGAQRTLSVFSIALLNDMGWYIANESMAEIYVVGQDKGCNFVEGRCNTWNATDYCNPSEFTNKTGGLNYRCAMDHFSGAACRSSNYTNSGGVPVVFNYLGLDNNSTGAFIAHGDFCFRPSPIYSSLCQDLSDQGFKHIGAADTLGSNSICFEIPTSSFWASYTYFGCYVHRCVTSPSINGGARTIQFQTADDLTSWKTCPLSGTLSVTTDAHTFEVGCPVASQWCNEENTINLQSDQPQPEPAGPTVDELINSINDRATRTNLQEFIGSLTPPGDATFGEPTNNGNAVTWVMTIVYDRVLTDADMPTHTELIQSFVAEALGTDVEKVGLTLDLTDVKRAAQATYEATATISGARQMFASALISLVFLALFI